MCHKDLCFVYFEWPFYTGFAVPLFYAQDNCGRPPPPISTSASNSVKHITLSLWSCFSNENIPSLEISFSFYDGH